MISDISITLAYYSIPLTLLYFVRRRPDFPFKGMIYLFIAFIFSCGTTHVIEVMTIWMPVYGVEGVAKAATALVSLVAAALLIPMTPKALALRNPEELEALNQRLTVEIGARQRESAERRRLDARVEDSLRVESLGTMAAGVAHDFNNLLTVIAGHTEMVKLRCAAEDQNRDDVDCVLEAAAAAADLSGQMLTYAGCDTESARPSDVKRTVQGMIHLLKAAIPPTVEVAYSLAGDLPHVQTGSSQVRQIVMNLVLNAVEALGAPGGLISVPTAPTRLSEEARDGVEYSFVEADDDRCVCLQVTDNAGGMSFETQRRIFDPFFSTKSTGRGLGLSVVLGIVKGSHGAVLLHSEQEKGSVFRVLLPVAPDAGASPAEPSAHPARSEQTRSVTVLIVDDNDSVRHLAKTVLLRAGYTVETARGGAEALEILATDAKGKIRLVFLDCSMPGMSGIEVLEALRSRGSEVPVILASGYDMEWEKPGIAAADSAITFLKKPFRPDQLLDAARLSLGPKGEERPDG